jgi:hypothetical protein
MRGEQYKRILGAIEYTLDQLRAGPKARDEHEKEASYEQRVEGWYRSKQVFVLFSIRIVKTVDEQKAKGYLNDLRRIREWV